MFLIHTYFIMSYFISIRNLKGNSGPASPLENFNLQNKICFRPPWPLKLFLWPPLRKMFWSQHACIKPMFMIINSCKKKIWCIFSISHFIIFGAVKYIEKGSMKIFSWHCEIKLITVKFSGFSGLICSKFLSIHLRSFSSLLCNDDKTTYLTFQANFLLIWYQLYPNIYLPPRRIELWEIIFLIEV